VEHVSGTEAVPPLAGTRICVAQYIRKSTDQQKYSTENQSDAIHEYAARRGMRIVRTYMDDGISGVTFEKRDAVQQLIDDVRSESADFTAILVYDISRWGRPQDVDEAAYYEYLCKRAGIAVHYCAEPFENDGSALATLFKSMKRLMAGEYSRELSVKVFAGHVRLFKLGFRQGGIVAYGIRRLLVDQAGVPKGVLAPGQYKSIQTDRVIPILGPPEEIATVRWIFSAFVQEGKRETEIAEILNKRGTVSTLGRPWTYLRVHKLLKNEIYIGNILWNRTSTKLGRRLLRNRPEAWLRVKCNFDPIIDPAAFEQAQAIIRERMRRRSDEEILKPVRRLLRKRGYLSRRLIDSTPGVPWSKTLAKRFGSLKHVYKLLDFKNTPETLADDELLMGLRTVLKKHGRLTERIINQAKGLPDASAYRRRFGSLSRAFGLIGYQPNRYTFQWAYQVTSKLSDTEVLELLRQLLANEGHLNARIINASREVPSVPTYERRFGSLPHAYELIGYIQKRKIAKSTCSTVRRKKRRKC
jgi:DNA invertase Pin-like site-specific DNA recombinase